MGIKILFEHGKLSGQNSSYGVKVIAINKETSSYCDVINAFPYLSKLSKKNLDNLFFTLDYMIAAVTQGTITKEGVEYQGPIFSAIREKYKDHF